MNLAERELQYSPSSMVGGDLTPFIDRYRRDCARVYAAHRSTTVSYGPLPTNTIDLFVAEADQGLHVYIHGGYWQQLSKQESVFPVPSFLAAGIGFAAVDYTLAPAATVSEMVAECVAVLGTLVERGHEPGSITLSGWSAGAQLAVMATSQLEPELRPQTLVLISGIFDLEPLIGTYVNEPLHLDVAEARRLSPLHTNVVGFPPATIIWGERDTDEFKRQSRAMTDHFRSAGVTVAEREIADRNHFDVIFNLKPPLARMVDEPHV